VNKAIMGYCEVCGSYAKLKPVKISLRTYGINHISEKQLCSSCQKAEKKGRL
jgi:hypothetical protein